MRRSENNSIMKKLMVPMILVMLIQTGLFFGTILWSGTLNTMSHNAFDILNQRVINRKNYLQNEMVQRWSNLGDSVSAVNNEVEGYLTERNMDLAHLSGDDSVPSDLLEKLSDDVLYLLRKNSVTGAFIVFDDLNENDSHSGIYLRDTDPESNSVNNSDILIERAPSNVTKSMGIPMDTWWTPRFKLTKESDFFYKPYEAAKEHLEIGWQDLGYWSRPFHLSEKDLEVITYSVPLVIDGKPYGVLGVELTTDYLRKLLPYDEIATDKQGAYLLAVTEGEELNFDNVIESGPIYKQLFGDANGIVLEGKDVHESNYEITRSERYNEAAVGSVQYLQLYNTHTPFENDRWALIGIIGKNDLFSIVNHVKTLILISMGISLALGVVTVIVVSRVVTRPITGLVRDLKSSDARLPLRLEKINIVEIDELAKAIENLSSNVADAASKLSQIVDMSNIQLGAFEYRKATGQTFCTGRLFEILGLEPLISEGSYVDTEQFKQIMFSLENWIESRTEQAILYRIEDEHRHPRWVRLELLEDEEKVMGVAVDITQETLEKRKIEYERDYDLLTNLLNRRAFHAELKRKFASPKELKVSALIMLDLDNLKYINDTYGHDYGDVYIQYSANALKKFAPYNVVLSRMSGDEFYVFIYGYEDKAEVRRLIADIQKEMLSTVLPLPNNDSIKIRVSAGVAWYPDDAEDYETLIRYADFAMYMVKNTTKGEFKEFDRASYEKDAYLLHGKEDLNRLIDGELVEYHFQPIVEVATASVFAYEALMRSKIDTLSTPLEILTLAKSQSKLYQIEQLTWFKALESFARLKVEEHGAKIFINSIPNQVLSERDMKLFETMYAPSLGRIVVELTEEEKLDEQSMVLKQHYCKQWGSQLAIDDFGTGYNGDGILLSLTPDYVKIDMSIVRNIDKDENRQRLLKNLVSYLKPQKIRTIAEGVETKEEMDMVISLGADYLQGYYLGWPEAEPANLSESLKKEIMEARDYVHKVVDS